MQRRQHVLYSIGGSPRYEFVSAPCFRQAHRKELKNEVVSIASYLFVQFGGCYCCRQRNFISPFRPAIAVFSIAG